MELVYLWVKKYKNIEKQGFNFSPRFECKFYDEYDTEGNLKNNCKLVICDKQENEVLDEKAQKCKSCQDNNYIENFFGDNINVTAIVGENGSGKSSILSSIVSKQRVFLVVFDNEFKVYTRNIQINTVYNVENLTNDFLKSILYYSLGDKYLSKSNPNLPYIDIEKTVELIVDNYSSLQEYSFDMFDFIPEFIHFRFKEDYKLLNDDEISEDLISSIKSALDWSPTIETGIIYEALRALQKIDDDYLNYLLYQFGDIASLFEHINLPDTLHPKDGYLILNIEDIQRELKKCELSFISQNEFKILKKYEFEKIRIQNLSEEIEDYKKLLFQMMKDNLDFNFFSENGASFNSLSDGEKSIYTFLVHLIDYKKQDFFFLLDEPDNTLHPEWQKKFVGELIKLLQKLDKKVHILLTTHSPFLLSDLPKENIIFLQDGKQVYPKIETFGANIHTLLSHGFFMKDGLMGEFAKEKINETIKFLNGQDSTIKDEKEAKKIIQSIGEPFLQQKLSKIFYEKFTAQKQKRIKELEAELQRLKGD